jgi:hypothetical protein
MTDMIQVMDLVVNAIIKQNIRALHVDVLFEEFKNWKLRATAAYIKNETLPKFKPSKTTLVQGLSSILSVVSGLLSTPTFRSALVKGFQRGMLIKSGQSFVQWTGMERRGKSQVKPDVSMNKFRFEDLCISPLEFTAPEQVMQLHEISDDELVPVEELVQSRDQEVEAGGSSDSDEDLPVDFDPSGSDQDTEE